MSYWTSCFVLWIPSVVGMIHMNLLSLLEHIACEVIVDAGIL